jgi:hypothetical protein
LHRRYRVDHLNLHRRRLHDVFYMDTLFSKVKSLSGLCPVDNKWELHTRVPNGI